MSISVAEAALEILRRPYNHDFEFMKYRDITEDSSTLPTPMISDVEFFFKILPLIDFRNITRSCAGIL